MGDLKRAWGAPLARLDDGWTRLEAWACAFALVANVVVEGDAVQPQAGADAPLAIAAALPPALRVVQQGRAERHGRLAMVCPERRTQRRRATEQQND